MLAASAGNFSIAGGCWTRLRTHSRRSEKPKKTDGGNCTVSLRHGTCLKGQPSVARDEPAEHDPRRPRPTRPCRGASDRLARRVSALSASGHPLLASGRYLTVFTDSTVRYGAERWPLKILPVKLGPRLPVVAVTLRNRTLTPSVQLFIDQVRAVTKTMSLADEIPCHAPKRGMRE
jgi:hypothetical protein